MRSSSAMRRASVRASSAHSSSVMPEMGISGRTSVAPMRGCAPLWWRMSISSAARRTPAKAASTTASGEPTKVTTVRLVASPGSTSSSFTPPDCTMAAVIASITVLSRPSLKLGTHSTIRFSISCAFRNSLLQIYRFFVTKTTISKRKTHRRPKTESSGGSKRKVRTPRCGIRTRRVAAGKGGIGRRQRPKVSVTPAMHQKPGSGMPPMSQ